MTNDFITDYCFACGKDNEIGLKLKFIDLDDGSMAYFSPQKAHQGSNNFMHGGLISTLLDEIMAREVWYRYAPAVTAKLSVNFLRPIPIGKEIHIIGKVQNIKKDKIYETFGEIVANDGTILANATATLFRISI